jgi:hypothetical protein
MSKLEMETVTPRESRVMLLESDIDHDSLMFSSFYSVTATAPCTFLPQHVRVLVKTAAILQVQIRSLPLMLAHTLLFATIYLTLSRNAFCHLSTLSRSGYYTP